MRVFQRLRALRAFEQQHLRFISTLEDQHLVREIGYHQAEGKPLTLKQLFLLDAGSIATVQRRLRRLRQLGVIQQRRSARDRRAVELMLSPKFTRLMVRYDALMASNGSPTHVCGLFDDDRGRRKLLAGFLGEGLQQGDRCLLLAAPEVQREVLAALDHPDRASESVTACDVADSVDAAMALVQQRWQEAKAAGRKLRLGSDMAGTQAGDPRMPELLKIEARLEALARQPSLSTLCVYDVRRFSSGELMRVLRCHRDHGHHPVLLG